MITYSIEIKRLSKGDFEKVAELAEEFFQTAKNYEQMPSEEITYEFIKKFAGSLNVIKDNKKVIGHTFILPCDKKSMTDFIEKRITEKQLFYRIRDKISANDYSALYLVSAQLIPEYQRKGLAVKSFVMQIKAYQKLIKRPVLFFWPLSKEGLSLAKKAADITGLELKQRKR
jgi:transcriptional regulator with XRE-family HTH domain